MYTVVINGKPTGPYLLTELGSLAITGETFIKKEGMDDFKEAHELLEVRELLNLNTIKVAPQYFASFERRLMANLFDIFSVYLIHAIVIAFTFIFLTLDKRLDLILYGNISAVIVFYMYQIIADASAMQGTLGKKLLGVKVTDVLGNRISIDKSIARNLSKIISNLTLGIGYIVSIFSKRNQCLHDMIADTLVIKSRLF